MELYKIAVDEYRFNVQLGWNRQQYYLVFNSALTGLGATLLGQNGMLKQLFAALVFVIAIFACFFGRGAITKAHGYYRKSVYKKTLIEDQLGLLQKLPQYTYAGANLSIATTSGMQSTTQILQDTEQWLNRPERQDSLVRYFRIFLLILAIINGLGVIAALWLWYQGTEKQADNSSAYYSLSAGLFQAAYIIVAELDFKEIRAWI